MLSSSSLMIKQRLEETRRQPTPHHESLPKCGESHHPLLALGTCVSPHHDSVPRCAELHHPLLAPGTCVSPHRESLPRCAEPHHPLSVLGTCVSLKQCPGEPLRYPEREKSLYPKAQVPDSTTDQVT